MDCDPFPSHHQESSSEIDSSFEVATNGAQSSRLQVRREYMKAHLPEVLDLLKCWFLKAVAVSIVSECSLLHYLQILAAVRVSTKMAVKEYGERYA